MSEQNDYTAELGEFETEFTADEITAINTAVNAQTDSHQLGASIVDDIGFRCDKGEDLVEVLADIDSIISGLRGGMQTLQVIDERDLDDVTPDDFEIGKDQE